DFQTAFEAAIDVALALETRVDAVLICGDLFDNHAPPPPLVDFFQTQLTRLREEDIPVVLISGFHDAAVYPDAVYHSQTFPGLHPLIRPEDKQPITFEFQGTQVHFYGVAWHQLSNSEPVVLVREDRPGLHIALLHGEVGEGPREPDEVPMRFSLETLKKSGMDYVALGFRHDYQVVSESEPAIVYPGTLESVTFAETEPRAFLVVEFDMENDEAELTVTRIPYKSRPVLHKTVDVSTLKVDDHAELAARLSVDADPSALMHLELVGTSNFIVHTDRLRDLLAPHFFLLELLDRTSFSDSAIVRLIKPERTIRGMFTRQLTDELEKAGSPEQRHTLEYALKAGLQRFLEGELL
ncbi:MAG TPA: DNA repair exonuclease, partial [Candidatus Xenobia bacterium]